MLHRGPLLADGSPSWVVQDPARNQFFRISWTEFEMLRWWSLGSREAIVEKVNESTPLSVTLEHIDALLGFLFQHQLLITQGRAGIDRLVELSSQRKEGWARRLLYNYLFFRIPLVRPDAFLDRTIPLVRHLFSRFFMGMVLLMVATSLFLVSRQWDAFLSTFLHFYTLSGLLILFSAILVAKLTHELGHAYAAKHFGLHVPTMGVAFIVLWPVLFTETSEAWKLGGRRERLIIGASGMLAELVLAAFATFAWVFLPDGVMRSAAFMLATTTWVLTLLVNANPFMRFDGYFLLSDAIGIQNLQDRSFALGRWRLRRLLFGFDDPAPESFSPAMGRFLIGYAWATWLYRFVLFLGIALVVYFLFFKALGILLMVAELYWFIGRPILMEMRQWKRQSGNLRMNPNLFITGLLLLTGVGLLVVPWQQEISAPALVRYGQHVVIYPPEPAQIKSVEVTEGQQVEEGDLLFRLSSPGLDHAYRLALYDQEVYAAKLKQLAVDERGVEARLVVEQQLAEAKSSASGLLKQQERLVVRAPFAGRAHALDHSLGAGVWINQNRPLLQLTQQGPLIVEAYIDARDAGGLDMAQSEGWYYPESLDFPAFPVTLENVERTNVRALSKPYLGSVYGGEIPVVQESDGRLVSDKAIYRALLRPGMEGVSIPHVLPGTVVLKGDLESWAVRGFRQVMAVFMRESGF